MRHIWPIVAVACLGLAVAVAAWFAVSVWEERLARAKFTAIAGDYASVLQNGLDDYLGKILAVRAFYDASVEVDPDEFNLFTSQILRRVRRRDALGLVPARQPAMSAPSSSARPGRQASADYAIRTWAVTGPMSVSPERDEYFPILYSTRRIQESSDLGHGPQFRARSKRGDPPRARREYHGDRPRASSFAIQSTACAAGFLALIPVYQQGCPWTASMSGAAIRSA